MTTLTRLLCLILVMAASCSSADASDAGIGSLTPEEAELIHAFRANPHPYRELLYGRDHRRPAQRQFIGPRDVIDVTLTGGKVVFTGKRRAYQPASIRLVRGEVREMVILREGRSDETSVTVGYLADGLHFDIPKPVLDGGALPRGFIVVPEATGWKTGEPFLWKGHLDSRRSASEAEDVTFVIRYVSH